MGNKGIQAGNPRKRKTLRRVTEGLSLCFEAQVGAGPKTVEGEESSCRRPDEPVHAPAKEEIYFFLVVFFVVAFLVDFLAAAFLAMALYLLS